MLVDYPEIWSPRASWATTFTRTTYRSVYDCLFSEHFLPAFFVPGVLARLLLLFFLSHEEVGWNYFFLFRPLFPTSFPVFFLFFLAAQVNCVDFPLSRVRMTGDIPGPDHHRVRDACKSGNDPMACDMLHLGYKFPA